MILLDEATSALDAESEYQVQQALDKLMRAGNQTIIVVAHRLSTIRDADEIIVVEHGQEVERGSYEELIKLGKVFKGLVSKQLVSGYIPEIDDIHKEDEEIVEQI